MLESIRGPEDLRGLNYGQLDSISNEIREFLINKVSKSGGHLGPNLGVVELTLAIHRIFKSPDDVILFDTGHQSYVHKIITGRASGFGKLRQRGGISGYPNRSESEHDVIENSHASSSLSWAEGIARGFKLTGESDRTVVVVVGDGATAIFNAISPSSYSRGSTITLSGTATYILTDGTTNLTKSAINIIAQIDMGRKYRKGIPEVIFAERKTTDEIKKIIVKVMEKSDCVLISRIQKKDYSKIVKFVRAKKLSIRDGKNTTTILIHKSSLKKNGGNVGIVTAGTSDIGVAEEARLTCEAMHCDTITTYDVGIAGLHRIFPIIKKFIESDVDTIIVAAGMEGALASVVSSLVNIPVIGLPTSVGYGYGEKGVASLASMLQSCSLGLSVVNIDNGIGAGAVASNIANRVRRR